VDLPDLTTIDVEYDHDLGWLQGLHGAALDKLEYAYFRSESSDIGDFLGAFESAALSAHIQNTLSTLGFYTSRPWNPNYSALLSFNQLKEVQVQFSCEGGCSSRLGDDIIVSLAWAMPKLEVLQLGRASCATASGITVNGLTGLACGCPHLSRLRIHFRATSLVEVETNTTIPSPSDDGSVSLRGDCVLSVLEVGETPIPEQSGLTVALVLLQNFPRITNVEYTNREWKTVQETIERCRRIGTFVHRTGEAHPPHIEDHK